jgi:hypothetical protein
MSVSVRRATAESQLHSAHRPNGTSAPKGPNPKAQGQRRGVSREAQPWVAQHVDDAVPVRDEPRPARHESHTKSSSMVNVTTARVATFQVAKPILCELPSRGARSTATPGSGIRPLRGQRQRPLHNPRPIARRAGRGRGEPIGSGAVAGTRLAVRLNSRPAALAFREREHGRQLANARKHDLPAIRKSCRLKLGLRTGDRLKWGG